MDASSTSVGRGTLLQVQAVPRDVTIPGQTPGAAAVRRRHGDPPAQAHGGRGGAPEHALRESGRAGARHGTEVSRVPGGPQTGRAGGPALHDEPGRADLSSEGGASGGDPKGSPGLAATLPEVESKPCHYADPAQPGSGSSPAAPTEPSGPSAFVPTPVSPDQHHLLEGSPLAGPVGSVCGTGIWPGLLRPVYVLLDVRRDSGSRREERRGEERLLCVQPRL